MVREVLVTESPRPLVVVAGATASGKGALARELAKRLDGEIVSADSRKIYRGLDIGTAKPSAQDQAAIPHHLLDCCDPGERFSAAEFVQRADFVIADIVSRGRLPIVCGGTGLYIRSLLRGIIDTPPRDDALRAELLEQEKQQAGFLHQRLSRLDPKSAARIPAGDSLRLVRALEVLALSGKSLSDFHAEHALAEERYRSVQLIPNWAPEILRKRVEERIERMLQAGWLAEVRRLRSEGASSALDVVGYKQLAAHLDGSLSLTEARDAITTAHWRYAKQQLTWFKGQSDMRWLPTPVNVDEVEAAVRFFLKESRNQLS